MNAKSKSGKGRVTQLIQKLNSFTQNYGRRCMPNRTPLGFFLQLELVNVDVDLNVNAEVKVKVKPGAKACTLSFSKHTHQQKRDRNEVQSTKLTRTHSDNGCSGAGVICPRYRRAYDSPKRAVNRIGTDCPL